MVDKVMAAIAMKAPQALYLVQDITEAMAMLIRLKGQIITQARTIITNPSASVSVGLEAGVKPSA